MNKTFKNIFYLFFPLFVGIIINIIILRYIDYNTLNQPPLAPPKFLFPIVWTIIYILMGLSYFIFKNNSNENENLASYVYYIQLFVNALWSIIFFVFKSYLFSVAWIILLDLLVLLLIKLFKNSTKISAWLNIPYLIWILFATYLTIGFYILN